MNEVGSWGGGIHFGPQLIPGAAAVRCSRSTAYGGRIWQTRVNAGSGSGSRQRQDHNQPSGRKMPGSAREQKGCESNHPITLKMSRNSQDVHSDMHRAMD